jgi:hypothetical protein
VCIKNVLHHSHGILIGCYVLVITDEVTRSVVCNKAEGGQVDHYDSHCDLQYFSMLPQIEAEVSPFIM